jgi:hypothetical protein
MAAIRQDFTCLRAGDNALRPAHCPTFLPVTSRNSFGMLSTAQNKCGVFAGIKTMLTGCQKPAIVCSRQYEEINKLRFSGGVCMHVIQCIVLLITFQSLDTLVNS